MPRFYLAMHFQQLQYRQAGRTWQDRKPEFLTLMVEVVQILEQGAATLVDLL